MRPLEGYAFVPPSLDKLIGCVPKPRIVFLRPDERICDRLKILRPEDILPGLPIWTSLVEIEGVNDGLERDPYAPKISGSDELNTLKIIEVVLVEAAPEFSKILGLLLRQSHGLVPREILQAFEACQSLLVCTGSTFHNASQRNSRVKLDINVLSLRSEHSADREKGGYGCGPSTERRNPLTNAWIPDLAEGLGMNRRAKPQNNQRAQRYECDNRNAIFLPPIKQNPSPSDSATITITDCEYQGRLA